MNGEKPREVASEINFEKDPVRKVPEEIKPRKKQTTNIAQGKELAEVSRETGEKEYNFRKMRDFEKEMIPLVEELKDKIESGEYSALLSDDAGGRIPTLVLDKILKEKSLKKIKTYFLAGGQNIAPRFLGHENQAERDQGLKNYLRKMDLGDSKLLVVTQFIASGASLRKIARELLGVGIKHFDFAAMTSSFLMNNKDLEEIKEYFKDKFNAEFFGGRGYASNTVEKEHEDLSGIINLAKNFPYPTKIGSTPLRDKKLKPVGSSEVKNADFYRKSREDIKLMAEKIMKQIWPEK